jgi:hypothetical protein
VRILALLVLLLPACRPPSEGGDVTPPSALDAGWLAGVTRDPASFGSLVDGSSRDGWVAFHRCAFEEAADRFSGDGPTAREARGRIELELALVHEDLARAGDVTWRALFDGWRERPGVPSGSGLPYVAGIAALERGDVPAARVWFDLGAGARDPEVASASRAMSALAGGGPAPSAPLGLVARYLGHLEARRSGDPGPLADIAGPLVEDHDADGAVVRSFGDPQALRSIAATLRHRALVDLDRASLADALAAPVPGADPLASVLFSACDIASPCTADGDVPRASPSMLDDLGLGSALPTTDDADQARVAVRALDARLDPWVAALHGSVAEDGRALLDDLSLAAVFRSRLLLAEARIALRHDQPNRALTLALLAQDLASARQIGPVNHPGLFAVLAEAQLRTGHTREALDALQVLDSLLPGLGGLDEAANDLAVLRGIDRYGDSKED